MFFVFLSLKLIGCFDSVLSFDWIWELIALFLTNQIAGNTIDFKMNVIKMLMELKGNYNTNSIFKGVQGGYNPH